MTDEKRPKTPLFEVIAGGDALPGDDYAADVTAAVVDYVQLSLDSGDPAQFLFNELSSLVSAAAIVFGKPPATVVEFLAKGAPTEWPEDALEQLVQAGLVEVRGGGNETGSEEGTRSAEDDQGSGA